MGGRAGAGQRGCNGYGDAHRTDRVGRRFQRQICVADAVGAAGAAGNTGTADNTGDGSGVICKEAGNEAGATDGAAASGGVVAVILHLEEKTLRATKVLSTMKSCNRDGHTMPLRPSERASRISIRCRGI